MPYAAPEGGEDYTLSFYAGRFRSWDNFLGDIFPLPWQYLVMLIVMLCHLVKLMLGNGCPATLPGWVLLGKVDG